MKKTRILSLLAIPGLALLAGCVSAPLAVAPVGPPPQEHVSWVGSGYLKVYSDRIEPQIGDYSTHYPHRGYTIYDAAGKPWQYVPNRVDKMDEMPALVKIPAGAYRIVAKSTSYGAVSVPVVVQAGQITVVHLDHNQEAPAGAAAAQLVRLPNGEVVGWRGTMPP